MWSDIGQTKCSVTECIAVTRHNSLSGGSEGQTKVMWPVWCQSPSTINHTRAKYHGYAHKAKWEVSTKSLLLLGLHIFSSWVAKRPDKTRGPGYQPSFGGAQRPATRDRLVPVAIAGCAGRFSGYQTVFDANLGDVMTIRHPSPVWRCTPRSEMYLFFIMGGGEPQCPAAFVLFIEHTSPHRTSCILSSLLVICLQW